MISGYDGNAKEFLEKAKEIWNKQGSKERGARKRYQIIIGMKNMRAALLPTVSTKSGTENLIAWNLTQDDIDKIKEGAEGVGLPVSSRPWLWFDRPPAVLPNEERRKPSRESSQA